MAKLPRDLTPRQVINVFKKLGYSIDHQTGSHIILYPNTSTRPLLSIPNHKTIRVGLLRNLIRDAGITVEEFVDLLK